MGTEVLRSMERWIIRFPACTDDQPELCVGFPSLGLLLIFA